MIFQHNILVNLGSKPREVPKDENNTPNVRNLILLLYRLTNLILPLLINMIYKYNAVEIT